MEKQAWAARVATGEAEGLRIPLARAVPASSGVGAAELAWAACMTSSRALSNPEGSMYLIPVIDMANHREGSPHTVRWTVGDGDETEAARGASSEVHGRGGGGVHLQLIAGADIKEGEEVGVARGTLPGGCHLWVSIGLITRPAVVSHCPSGAIQLRITDCWRPPLQCISTTK